MDPDGGSGSDEVGTLPTNDFVWHSSREYDAALPENLPVEHKALMPSTTADARHIARQIAKAAEKNKRSITAVNVIVDIGEAEPSEAGIAALRTYNLGAHRKIGRLWLMSGGRLLRIALE